MQGFVCDWRLSIAADQADLVVVDVSHHVEQLVLRVAAVGPRARGRGSWMGQAHRDRAGRQVGCPHRTTVSRYGWQTVGGANRDTGRDTGRSCRAGGRQADGRVGGMAGPNRALGRPASVRPLQAALPQAALPQATTAPASSGTTAQGKLWPRNRTVSGRNYSTRTQTGAPGRQALG